MLSLKIDGSPVELPPDFSITLNLKSPIFGETGSYSYPFKLPNTPRNAIRTGFRHRISNTADIYHEFAGTYFWKGMSLFSGTIKLRVLTSDYFEGYLLEGNGDFTYQRKNTSLQNIDFGEMNFETEYVRLNFINQCAQKVYPERNVSFPQILNKSYFDELPTDPGLLNLNNYRASQINITTTEFNRTIIVPMLYLRYVLKTIFEQLKFTFDDTFFATDAAYDSLVLYNSVDCNGGEEGFFQYDKLSLFLNYHVPRMSLNDFFSGLETFFNIRFFVNNNTATVKLVSVDQIVKSDEYTEFSDRLISIVTEPEEKITGFHLKMDMSTDDETYTIQAPYQEWVLNSIKPPVQSVSDLAGWPASTIFDTRFVVEQDTYYILNSSKEWQPITDMYYTWNLFSQWVYKNRDQSIDTKFSSLMSENIDPYNAIIGNKRDEWESVTPKLLFIRWEDNGTENSRVSGRGFVTLNYLVTHSLLYPGENGLMNKYYKAYCDFRISTKLVKIVKQMEFRELKNFDFSKKYMIGGVKYLVKSIQVVLKKDRIMPATLECYICN